MKLDLPVLLMLLLISAVAQVAVPPLPGIGKLPLIVGVAVYYSLNRTFLIAVLAAAWGGVLLDGMGGMPGGVSAITLVVVSMLAAAFKGVVPEGSVIASGVFGAAVAPGLMLIQAIALRSAYLSQFSWKFLLGPLGMAAILGGVSSIVISLIGMKLDLLSGNVKPRKEIEEHGG